MYFVLAHKDNDAHSKRFLLPKTDEQSEEWVEIKINEEAGEFFAKKVKGTFKESADWQRYQDSTFATSLFSHFLHNEK
jgi:hypothetical protein